MLIRHTNLHPGGSRHSIGGVVYFFEPRPEDPMAHVAEVSDPAHVERFLSVPGFEPFDAVDLDALDREGLAAIFRERFGKEPHWRLGVDAMRARLRED
jgi:hypothetical protein